MKVKIKIKKNIYDNVEGISGVDIIDVSKIDSLYLKDKNGSPWHFNSDDIEFIVEESKSKVQEGGLKQMLGQEVNTLHVEFK